MAAGRRAAAVFELGVDRLLRREHAALAGGLCIVEDVAQLGPVALCVFVDGGGAGGLSGRGRVVEQAAEAARGGRRAVWGRRGAGAGEGGGGNVRGGDVAVPYRIVYHPAQYRGIAGGEK